MSDSYIIDFHSHVLPGADHGSNSLEVSLKQIDLAKKAGIDILVATPHFYPHIHSLEAFVAQREASFAELAASLVKDDCAPRLLKGAEVLMCPNIHKLKGFDKLCIEGTRTILLELPYSAYQNYYTDTIGALIDKNYNVVLAHADRYPKEYITPLLSIGARIQLNVESLSSLLKNPHLFEWVDDGYVVALGSDIHMVDKNVYRRFDKARKKLGASFDVIMTECMQYVHSASMVN